MKRILPCGRNKCKKGKCSLETFYIHGWHRSKKWDFGHHLVPPMSSSITYRVDSAERAARGFHEFSEHGYSPTPIYIYDRLGEPLRDMLEENLAHIERGEICVTFSSGMAAIASCLLALVKSKEQILSHKVLYGCTHSLFTKWLPRLDISVKLIDMRDLNQIEDNLTKDTRVVYFETPSNPDLQLIDIEKISQIVHNKSNTTYVVIDNSFATPFCQRPLEFGADFVVHSLSKDIEGFGTDLGGAVITRKEFLKNLLLVRKDFGGVLSSRNAWHILVYGLSSLHLRLKHKLQSAMKVAKFLENHSKVEKVLYPGLNSFPQKKLAHKQMKTPTGEFAPGTLIYFILKGTIQDAKRFLDRIAKKAYSITLAVSLGQVKTLIESPVLMTHATLSKKEQEEMELDERGIRIAIGLEDPDDIIEDLNNALK